MGTQTTLSKTDTNWNNKDTIFREQRQRSAILALLTPLRYILRMS